MNKEIVLALIGAGGVLLGVVVSSIVNLLTIYLQNKSNKLHQIDKEKRDCYIDASKILLTPEIGDQEKLFDSLNKTLWYAQEPLYSKLLKAIECYSTNEWEKTYGMTYINARKDINRLMKKELGIK